MDLQLAKLFHPLPDKRCCRYDHDHALHDPGIMQGFEDPGCLKRLPGPGRGVQGGHTRVIDRIHKPGQCLLLPHSRREHGRVRGVLGAQAQVAPPAPGFHLPDLSSAAVRIGGQVRPMPARVKDLAAPLAQAVRPFVEKPLLLLAELAPWVTAVRGAHLLGSVSRAAGASGCVLRMRSQAILTQAETLR